MAEIYRLPLYDSSLQAYYRMEGNGNDSKNTNNPTTETAITYSAGNGKYTQGAGFNGSTSNIVIPDNNTLDVTGSITIAFWVNLTSAVGFQTAIYKGHDVSGVDRTINYAVDFGASGLVPRFVFVNSLNFVVFQSNSSVATGSLYHIAVQHSFGTTGETKIFINGNSVGGTWTSGVGNETVPANTDTLDLGAMFVSGTTFGSFLNGNLDDIGIWNRLLSKREIVSLCEDTGPSLPRNSLRPHPFSPGLAR